MEFFNFLWQVFVFIITTSFEIVVGVVDQAVFTLEDNEVLGKIIKVRYFQ